MSGNPEDEAKARLEVAQLYEGMPGQAVKAARYYFAAAEIFRNAGIMGRARELYQKVVQLEPGNAQAQQILTSLIGGAAAAAAAAPPSAATPTPRPAAAAAAPSAPAPSAANSGEGPVKVMVPTPWISREPRYVAAARAQLASAPDRRDFPWDPLPPVDANKVAKRAEDRKAAQREAERKNATAVESAFGAGQSKFSAGGATGTAKFGAPSGGLSRPAAPAAPAAQAPQQPSRFSSANTDIRGGNRDLADAIRKRLQGG